MLTVIFVLSQHEVDGGEPVVAGGRHTKSGPGGLTVQLGAVILVCQHTTGQSGGGETLDLLY